MSTRPRYWAPWQLGTMVKYHVWQPYLALTEMATVRSQALATVCVHSVRAQSESHVDIAG